MREKGGGMIILLYSGLTVNGEATIPSANTADIPNIKEILRFKVVNKTIDCM